jgi:phage baseplate assembly protein W
MKTVFHSIHYPLAIDAGHGKLAEEPDYPSHVEQLMMQVLMTAPGERVNLPEFGCGIRQMVFVPNSEAAASLAQVSVYEALNRWLSPVIEVSQVDVEADNATLRVNIAYTLKARLERRYLNVELSL